MVKTKYTDPGLRREFQQKFDESGEDLIIGSLEGFPLPLEDLLAIDETSSLVVEVHDSGLSGTVYRLDLEGKSYALKVKGESQVRNIDGRTSFLNEIQRRKELLSLKRGNPRKYRGIVDTIYAHYRKGIILSHWIEGGPLRVVDPVFLESLYQTLWAMEQGGIFEYDLCGGNLLVGPDNRICFNDFGYSYRYNPLVEYNPDGRDNPVFHSAERFESRFFMNYLYKVERWIGLEAALKLYRWNMEAASVVYGEKLQWLQDQGADKEVIQWVAGIIKRWESGPIEELYRLDLFRSSIMDVHDDITGKTCTPGTLEKILFVQKEASEKYPQLKEAGMFFWGDENKTLPELLAGYKVMEKKVRQYQLPLKNWENHQRQLQKTLQQAYGPGSGF